MPHEKDFGFFLFVLYVFIMLDVVYAPLGRFAVGSSCGVRIVLLLPVAISRSSG